MATKKLIKFTKQTGKINYVEFINQRQYDRFVKRSKTQRVNEVIEVIEVDESEVDKLPFRTEKSIHTAQAAHVALKQKDDEIARLKAQLAEKEGGTPGGEPTTQVSTSQKASDAVAYIADLKTAEEVEAYIAGDSRASVLKAAAEKIEALKVEA